MCFAVISAALATLQSNVARKIGELVVYDVVVSESGDVFDVNSHSSKSFPAATRFGFFSRGFGAGFVARSVISTGVCAVGVSPTDCSADIL